MAYADEVLADSPLAYWRLGESAGTVAADATGNGRNLTWAAAPVPASGLLIGDSDGATKPGGTYATRAPESWMLAPALTVEAWVKYDSLVNGAALLNKYGLGSLGGSLFLLWLTGGKLSFIVRSTGGDKTVTSPDSAATGITYHVVGTCDGVDAKLYVNGSLVASAPSGPLVATSSDNLVLGLTTFNGAVTNGTIDEVGYYGSALSSTRVAAHYAAGSGGASTIRGTLAATLPGPLS